MRWLYSCSYPKSGAVCQNDIPCKKGDDEDDSEYVENPGALKPLSPEVDMYGETPRNPKDRSTGSLWQPEEEMPHYARPPRDPLVDCLDVECCVERRHEQKNFPSANKSPFLEENISFDSSRTTASTVSKPSGGYKHSPGGSVVVVDQQPEAPCEGNSTPRIPGNFTPRSPGNYSGISIIRPSIRFPRPPVQSVPLFLPKASEDAQVAPRV